MLITESPTLETAPSGQKFKIREMKKRRTAALVRLAARKLYEKHGYNETKARDIAQQAGMSTGAVFGNWDSIGKLWTEVTGLRVPGSTPWSEMEYASLRASVEHLDLNYGTNPDVAAVVEYFYQHVFAGPTPEEACNA